MAVVSSVPVLKILTLRVTFLPRLWVKKPLSTPTSAGAWVMLARKPSRSVTGASAGLEPDLEDAGDEPHAAASTVTATAPAESSARRIKVHLIDQVGRYYRIKPYGGSGRRMPNTYIPTRVFIPFPHDQSRSVHAVCMRQIPERSAAITFRYLRSSWPSAPSPRRWLPPPACSGPPHVLEP